MKSLKLVLFILAVGVCAQDIYSVVDAFASVLPSSLADLALTNSAAFESAISSEFAGGATPSWFSALPTDVQDFIAPTDVAGSGASTTSDSALDIYSVVDAFSSVLPSSLADLALTNSAAFESAISSEFAGGATPSWFSALPTDVQDFIAPTDSVESGVSTFSSTASDGRPSATDASGPAPISTASDSAAAAAAAAATMTGLLGLSVAGAIGLMGILVM